MSRSCWAPLQHGAPILDVSCHFLSERPDVEGGHLVIELLAQLPLHVELGVLLQGHRVRLGGQQAQVVERMAGGGPIEQQGQHREATDVEVALLGKPLQLTALFE